MSKLDLKERYECYTKNISRSMMPISLKEAYYLYDLCIKMRPKYILDSGSGFSSFVFRKYKALSSNPTVRIITIDHSKIWLARTREFIRDCGLVPEDCYLVDNFMRYANLFEFDFIFEDYHFPARSQRLHYDIRSIKKNGIILMDDAHLVETQALIWKYAKKRFITVNYLKELEDVHGRYPALIKKR